MKKRNQPPSGTWFSTLLAAALTTVSTPKAQGTTVTSLGDSGPGTLREALANIADGDTIHFAVTGMIQLTSEELLVNKSVSIAGPGPDRLSVGGEVGPTFFRVFHIGSNTVVSLSGLSVTGGGGDDGAGIFNEHASLTISNCAIINNAVGYGAGGGIYNDGYPEGSASLRIVDSIVRGGAYAGGGIFNSGNLTILGSALEGSTAGNGGAIYNYYGSLRIADCHLSDNSADGSGGAIYNGNSSLSVSNCVFSRNWAGVGGGIANQAGGHYSSSGIIVNSSFSSNTVFYYGGGIYNAGSSNRATLEIIGSTLDGNWANRTGAGLWNGGATLRFLNGTISGNRVAAYASAIYNGGRLTLLNSTIVGEPGAVHNNAGAAALQIGSSVLQTSPSGSAITNGNRSAILVSLGYNVCNGDGGGLLNQPTDLLNTDPLLGPLADNGGPTFTHALLPGSPAINKGKNLAASACDQRSLGFARTFDNLSLAKAAGGDGTDIGAFEVQNQPPVAKCQSVTVVAGADCTAHASIDNGSFDPDGDPISLSQSPPGPYPVGSNAVTLTVTDSQGASSSCSALVIVRDATPPQITCAPNATVDATSPAGAAVSFAPIAADDCSGQPLVVCEPPSGSQFPIGTTTVICTATDPAGNSASCEFQVTVLGAREMLEQLLAAVNWGFAHPQPLAATLEAALASMDRNNPTAAINQLQAFQNKVQAQVASSDRTLAQDLLQAAQGIITVLARQSVPR